MLHRIQVRPLGERAWEVGYRPSEHPMVFRSGARAEATAKTLAVRLADERPKRQGDDHHARWPGGGQIHVYAADARRGRGGLKALVRRSQQPLASTYLRRRLAATRCAAWISASAAWACHVSERRPLVSMRPQRLMTAPSPKRVD